jgi:hypothetical protein
MEGYIPAIVWRVCARKDAYKTKRDARLAGKAMRDKTGARISSYWCPFSGPDNHYHVGKKTRLHD